MKNRVIRGFSRLLLRTVCLSLFSIAWVFPAQANCSDSVGRLEIAAPIMTQWMAELKSRSDWGVHNPYDRLEKDRIWLNAAFDELRLAQKQDALALLALTSEAWWDLVQKYLPESERGDERVVEIGALHPYAVYASDGRLLAAAYDGCTREILLTEHQRFQWYSNQFKQPREALYNGGQPAWRQNRFPLAPAQEKALRQRFWRALGYSPAKEAAGWWIAWVPERGWFEINLPSAQDLPHLKSRFINKAPKTYRYVVLDKAGEKLWP
ncbi:hypothetical protein COW36_18265 [bacterium (Candidatus Blackallbacteria) CG17_big_fil_post_rev_8_21_14_2_50_48_46]|uniref:Uncharacterized protein n=1 Tax=bacterium (Candidatus Blackallbacteria) CG17_big_fil_post_rev_8_21_14_2_50_48_46 TaxID=2014261 RepID=A0A2M7G0Y1_9BACT|nr:MAG: hypothetical protein COW64_00470 [bacterium (Candidatus Blackallbacteria) CG18_big_fil_WC_8_21_14_2_50_49_26]PIW15361.1 MAG: hypothetical protein COW36_18265 [bacterium (Candidatus Blackallbacteria) CG17_big_fil_post_rev_8_21_14_2_50_48_46]PIW49778.1 MAG: hypothetical protein COW20_05100 [bacterium (Candidatus Blackallbacteria) CG13_big_fil_rev_8_21_14_2_50_49_14]